VRGRVHIAWRFSADWNPDWRDRGLDTRSRHGLASLHCGLWCSGRDLVDS
jgi:hypothetical protein